MACVLRLKGVLEFCIHSQPRVKPMSRRTMLTVDSRGRHVSTLTGWMPHWSMRRQGSRGRDSILMTMQLSAKGCENNQFNCLFL